METKRLRLNNVELTYFEQGRGIPLVLVHGSLSDYRSWRGQLGALSQQCRVIAYSRRYHYPNPWVGDVTDYSVALHAGDLAAVIQRLDLESAHVVGASYGASTTLVAALRYPTLVRSVVLGEPPMMPWLRRSAEGEAMWENFRTTAWEPTHQAFRRGHLADGVKIFVDGVNGAGTYGRMSPTGRRMLMDNARAMQAEADGPEDVPPVSCADLQRIAVPVLLLNGEFSPKFFRQITDELARCLPNPTRAVIARASHSMHLENPRAYAESVLSFLQSVTMQKMRT